MSARVTWRGLDAFRAQLRTLPQDLTDDAGGIVQSAAQGAEASIVAAYPRRTGDLASKVRIVVADAGRFGVSVIVKNIAKHAALFEHGTQARHTAIGANRGSMPPGHVFIPRVIKARRAMYERLKAMLVAHGLKVSGDA